MAVCTRRLGLDCDEKKKNVLCFFCGSREQFMGPVNTDFNKFFFKTEFYGTIHTFKNYFITIFIVFSNKRCLNKSSDNKIVIIKWIK